MATLPNLDNQNTTKPAKTAKPVEDMDIEDVLALDTDDGEVEETDDADTDEGDEAEDQEGVAETEGSDEAEEAPPEPKAKHQNSPEQRKIVEQKRTIALLEKKARELEEKVASAETQKVEQQKVATKDQLKANYVKAGYDEDTANEMAENKMEILELRQATKATSIALDNAEVIAKYPQAKRDMAKLIDIMDKTGFDFEQACLGQYGKQAIATPAFEQTAKQSVLNAGRPVAQSNSDTISRLARSSEPVKGVALTQAERADKAEVEKFAGEITDERYKELKKSFGY